MKRFDVLLHTEDYFEDAYSGDCIEFTGINQVQLTNLCDILKNSSASKITITEFYDDEYSNKNET